MGQERLRLVRCRWKSGGGEECGAGLASYALLCKVSGHLEMTASGRMGERVDEWIACVLPSCGRNAACGVGQAAVYVGGM
jgi:hypothetical protein